MEEFLASLTLALIWALNGFLVLAYTMAEYVLALLLLPALTWLTADIEDARRPWMMAASLLAVGAALFAPPVVGVWLTLMGYASILAILVEKFDRASLRWRVVGGLTMYSLIGLGFLIYRILTPILATEGGFFAQGQGYLNVIISIAVWFAPLAYLGILVQGVLVHPPEPQAPVDTIRQVRTRGRN